MPDDAVTGDVSINSPLARRVRDSRGRAYKRTEIVELRRTMAQAQAAFLDKLRRGAKVASSMCKVKPAKQLL